MSLHTAWNLTVLQKEKKIFKLPTLKLKLLSDLAGAPYGTPVRACPDY